MSFKSDELLLEKLYLRLEYFKTHTAVKGIEISLNSRYFSSQNLFEELQKTFDFPIKFIYNLNVEDYSVKLVNHIDDSKGIWYHIYLSSRTKRVLNSSKMST